MELTKREFGEMTVQPMVRCLYLSCAETMPLPLKQANYQTAFTHIGNRRGTMFGWGVIIACPVRKKIDFVNNAATNRNHLLEDGTISNCNHIVMICIERAVQDGSSYR